LKCLYHSDLELLALYQGYFLGLLGILSIGFRLINTYTPASISFSSHQSFSYSSVVHQAIKVHYSDEKIPHSRDVVEVALVLNDLVERDGFHWNREPKTKLGEEDSLFSIEQLEMQVSCPACKYVDVCHQIDDQKGVSNNHTNHDVIDIHCTAYQRIDHS